MLRSFSSDKTLATRLASVASAKTAREFELARLTRAQVRQFLLASLSSQSSMRYMASMSYTHQLGFDKILLSSGDANRSCVRLHYWESEMHGQDSDIHSHCAAFSSKVMTGSLSSREYVFSAFGRQHHRYEYCFELSIGCSTSKYLGVAALEETHTCKIQRDQQYSLCADALHQTVDVQADTVTISIWGPRLYTASVLRPILIEDKSDSRSLGVCTEYLEARLIRIAKLLGDEIDTQ